MTRVVIVPTGIANLASVVSAFRRLGVTATEGSDADEIDAAERVVLPGVGAFGAAVAELDRIGVREALLRRIGEGRPTLAICVGMQLLAEASEETPGAPGLGVVPQMVRRFGDRVHVPQLGWNKVEPSPDCRYVEAGWAYFANSYRLGEPPPGWAGAFSDHGGQFVAAVERGDVLACQFHPELSGSWGTILLDGWLTATGGGR